MKINKVITVTLDSEDVEKAIKDYIVKSDESLNNINVSAAEVDGTFKITITQDVADVPTVKIEDNPESTEGSVEEDLASEAAVSEAEEPDTTTDDNPFGL